MNEAMPKEVMSTLTKLVSATAPMHIAIKPWDAWTTVAIIQYATRNPQLSPIQRDQAIAVGRAIQAALAAIAPEAAAYLEDGWNPALDVPNEREAGGR